MTCALYGMIGVLRFLRVRQGTERTIHVSADGGEVWNIAQLPTVNHEQFYSMLSANQDMIFMHVDDPGGQYQL